MSQPLPLDITWVLKHMDRTASSYDQCSKIPTEIGTRLIERIPYIKHTPKKILDVGAGTGNLSPLLWGHYPSAHITHLDPSKQRLEIAKHKHQTHHAPVITTAPVNSAPPPADYLVGDVNKMAFDDHSFDMVFSNLCLPWCNELSVALTEINRVLKPGGLLLFSSLGPDSFQEIRDTWAQLDDYSHVNHYWDMHDIGDAMQYLNFEGSVVDSEYLTVEYPDFTSMTQDIKLLGLSNTLEGRTPHLLSRSKLNQWKALYPKNNDDNTSQPLWPVTLEIIYGHAWGKHITPGVGKVDSKGDVKINIKQIPKRSLD